MERIPLSKQILYSPWLESYYFIMSDQKYIAERIARFQDAYNRLDIEDSMSFYA